MAHLFICPNCGTPHDRDRAQRRLPPAGEGLLELRLRLPVRAARRLLPGAERRVLRHRPVRAASSPAARGSFELTGLADEQVIGRPANDVLGLKFADGERPRRHRPRVGRPPARQARRGQRRGRPARPGQGRPVPGLRRRRGHAARPHPDVVAHGLPSSALTARRRNLFILLLVAGLLAGSLFVDLRQGDEARPRPARRRRARLPGRADPAAADRRPARRSIARSTSCATASTHLGVAEPEIQRSGDDQISVGLPDVENADEAQQQVGQVAQLFFYDWEPNVIGPDGKPAPTDPEVTGGPAGRLAPAR